MPTINFQNMHFAHCVEGSMWSITDPHDVGKIHLTTPLPHYSSFDFEFICATNRKYTHNDYWFAVNGQSLEYLLNKYANDETESKISVVYSKDENIVGVKVTYKLGYDIVTIDDDDELKTILRDKVSTRNSDFSFIF